MSSKRAHNVLFIPSGSIGDALMMICLCAEMATLTPDIRCTIIARRNAGLIRDLALAYPFIQVIEIHKNVGGILSLLWHSFARPYVVLMPAVFGKGLLLNTKNLFTLLKLRPGTRTAGLLRETEPNPYNVALSYNHSILHYDNMRDMARAGGVPVLPEGAPIARLQIVPATPALGLTKDSYIVFHPFGSSSWKSFPPRRVHELLTQLSTQYPAMSFVVTGGPENTEEAERIIEGVPRTYTAAGLPIREAATLIADARLYIGVDTGTTHLACLFQQQSILLEHNASPEWLPTYNPNAVILTNDASCACKGRKNGDCRVDEEGKPYHRCLYDIADQTILEAVRTSVGRVLV